MRLAGVALPALYAVLYALAYPPSPFGRAAWVALAVSFAGFTATSASARSPRAAFLAGATFTGLSTALITTDVTFRLAVAAVPAVAYPAVAGGAAAVLINLLPTSVRYLAAPLLWTSVEALRAWITGGTYWWHLSQALASAAWARGLAGIAGRDGAALAVLAAGAGIAAFTSVSGNRGKAAVQGVLLIALAASAVVVGTRALITPQGRTVRLAAVQTQYGIYEKWRPENLMRQLETLRSLTARAASQGARLVVWPETASPGDPYARPEVMKAIAQASSSTTVAAGALVGPPMLGLAARLAEGPVSIDQARNTLLFVSRGDVLGTYAKVAAFPYGELGLRKGEGWNPVKTPVGITAPLICWENAVPGASVRYATSGANVAVVAATLGWFGTRTDAQYLAHSRMLAAELRIPVVQSVNLGTAAIIGPLGDVLAAGPRGETTVVVGDTTVPDNPSRGPVVGALIRAAGLAAGLLSVLWAGAARRSDPPHPASRARRGEEGPIPPLRAWGQEIRITPLLWSVACTGVLVALYLAAYRIAGFPTGHPAASLRLLMGLIGFAATYSLFGPIWARTEATWGKGTAHVLSVATLAAIARTLLPIEAAAWLMICIIPLSIIRARYADPLGPATGVAVAASFALLWVL